MVRERIKHNSHFPRWTDPDYSKTPFLVIWETTHACDLACVHCRAEAEPDPDPAELSHEEARKLIDDVKQMGTPILIFSGGDPLKRADLPDLIYYAHQLGLRTGTIPAVTPLLTRGKVIELKESGLSQLALSLDSADPKEHDSFRKRDGVFDHTMRAVGWAKSCGLGVQINSLVNVHNQERLDELIHLVEGLGIVFWEVFFLVPIGRAKELLLLEAEKFEEAFEKIYQLNKRASFIVKVTEAPHYRRFFYEKEMQARGMNHNSISPESINLTTFSQGEGTRGSIGLAPKGVNSGKGFLFVSCRGEIMPSGFLPVVAGNVRHDSLADIYRYSNLFKKLRDTSLLKGRCGICFYKGICGGSRARAYSLTGDYFEEDPCCVYQPVLTKQV